MLGSINGLRSTSYINLSRYSLHFYYIRFINNRIELQRKEALKIEVPDY